jgi:hypothetical protein
VSTCPGCGGVVGRDCFNPPECEWIMRDQAARYAALQYDPTPQPCQGCHYITGQYVACLGICVGMTCQEDADARAAAWAALPTIHADREPTP